MKTENVVNRKFNFIVDHVRSSLLLLVWFRHSFVDDLKSYRFYAETAELVSFLWAGMTAWVTNEEFCYSILSLRCFGCKQTASRLFRSLFRPPQLFIVLLRHQLERHWISKRYSIYEYRLTTLLWFTFVRPWNSVLMLIVMPQLYHISLCASTFTSRRFKPMSCYFPKRKAKTFTIVSKIKILFLCLFVGWIESRRSTLCER